MYFFLFDTNLVCVYRGNLEKRLATIDNQMIERKKIKLDKVFVRPKKRVLNQLHPKNKRTRRLKKKKKKKRRHRQHAPRRHILDSQASLDLLLDSQTQLSQLSQQHQETSQQLSISPTPSQEYNPASQLCLSLSAPTRSSPIMSLEMPPLTQTSPSPLQQTSPPHPATAWDKILSPCNTKQLLNRMRGNISVALTAVDGKTSLSRKEIAGVTEALHAAQRQAEQIARLQCDDYLQID